MGFNSGQKLAAALCFFSASGCAGITDYVGGNEDAFGLNIKRELGPGNQFKDYYLVENARTISVGDSKEAVRSLLGSPDSIADTLEGYQIWLYEKRELRLVFDKDKLREWHAKGTGSSNPGPGKVNMQGTREMHELGSPEKAR